MKIPNVKVKASKSRKWLKRIFVSLAIIILLPLTLFTIGWFNRDRIIDMLQERYSENSTGTLTIGKVNASFLNGFPNVGFTLKDINHTNNDTITDQSSKLQIEEAKLIIGARKLLSGNFSFKRIVIKNAVFSSEVNSTKSPNYFKNLKLEKQKTKQNGLQLPTWLDKHGTTFILENIKYSLKDHVLNKHFDLHVHKLRSDFKGSGFLSSGKTTLNVTINNLGFNMQRGSFFNGAHVTGNFNYSVNLENNQIEIQDFPLNIDHQTFQLNANFNFSNGTGYVFRLQNSETDFKAVKGLLTKYLADKLENFDIQKPIKSNINIDGTFEFGNNPDIEAEFSTTDNDVIISDKFHFKNTSFSGSLTTDIYESDSLRTAKKSTKDFKLIFATLDTELEQVKINARDSYYKTTPDVINFIDANVRLDGKNEALVTIIETDNFDFKGGTFTLDAHISGDIPNPYQFLNKAKGEFNLNNTRVILKKNGLQLPIQSISIALDNEDAVLRNLIINLSNGEDLILKGTLKNISGLLSKTPTFPTTSQISINSENLNINDVLVMAKEFVPSSPTKVEDRKNLHETLDAIFSQFHPQFNLNIGALTYNDVVINDVKSNVGLIDSETILLQNFDFTYDDAITNLKGLVRVHNPESKLKNAIYLDAEANSSGSIKVFKDLFNIELFKIESGDFKFYGQVKGNVQEFNELLNNARGDLILKNVNLYYEPAEMDVSIDSLSLFVNDSDIFLKEFNLEIDEHYPITLDGHIRQFPNFLLDEIQESGSIFLKITAPFIDGNELLATVNAFKNEEKSVVLKNKRPLYSIFKDINKFNPEIELVVDSLKYKGLFTENINAQIYFENDSILKLNYLNLNYKETVAKAYGEVNAHTSYEELNLNNPFNLDFHVKVKGKSADLNDYLKTTNFVFQSGEFEFIGNYKAQSKDLKLLNPEGFGNLKIGGTVVKFKAANLQVPIDSLHIEIKNDLATLKTLDIQLPGKSKVYFSGSIDHFSEFINDTTDLNHHSSNFSIHAPYIDTFDIQEFLKNSFMEDRGTKTFNLKKWKGTMMKINTSFYPTIAIQVDTLKHELINITGFESKLLFDNNDNFTIEDIQLDFHGGSLKMDLSIGIKNNDTTPVAIDMQVNDMDLHQLISSFDYFQDESLKQTDSIQGNLNCRISANGVLDNEGKLNLESLNGTLHLELEDLVIYDYKTIMENIPLMKAERFKNLRLRPIVQTFEIKNGEIIIPQTEIQSSAIHLFVEGRLNLNEYMNIWLSVPWNNLKRNDGLSLPEKTSYKDAGAKFFVQFLQDTNSKKARNQKVKIKIKLGNRKLRKLKTKLK